MSRQFFRRLGGLLLMGMMLFSCASAGGLSPLPLKDVGEIGGRFYMNPQGIDNIGDPFVLTADGKYYVFATGGGIGFNVWSSDDLATFSSKKKALLRAAWANGDYWAPEVYAYQGKYVMLFSARRTEDKSLRIGIAFADKPEGIYKDTMKAPLLDPGYAVIDASLFVDDDGTPYLYYSRDCSENLVGANHESHSYVVPLAKDLMSLAGEPVHLIVPDQAWELHSGDYRWNEGPVVVKHEGKYYLYYSANYFASKEYGVGVAVADSPMGPFVKMDSNPLLTYTMDGDKVTVSGPGHNSFFTVGDELFTAYHTHTYPDIPSGNRQLNYDRAGFHGDGTAYINGPTLAAQLKPYEMLGMKNAALEAQIVAQGENAQALTDGDYCISPASKAYAFRGTGVDMTYKAPVKVDTVILYPGFDAQVKGKIIINGTYVMPFDLAASRTVPGGNLVLHFEKMDVSSISIVLDNKAELGEIIVLADK